MGSGGSKGATKEGGGGKQKQRRKGKQKRAGPTKVRVSEAAPPRRQDSLQVEDRVLRKNSPGGRSQGTSSGKSGKSGKSGSRKSGSRKSGRSGKVTITVSPFSDPRQRPHYKARQSPYQFSDPPLRREPVDDSEVPWYVHVDEYAPVEYTAPTVAANPVWADRESDLHTIPFNTRDHIAKVDRTSFEGEYEIDVFSGRPLNPCGRTGVSGRGLMGRYGPNHAADPVVTRWCTDEDGNRLYDRNNLPVVEFVAVKRGDTGEWAIPGGMVDPGEAVSRTLKREFAEEALNSMDLDEDERTTMSEGLAHLFNTGVPLYRGYSDDIRNTDNAWIETVCMHYHDYDGKVFNKFPLKADGNECSAVAWVKLHRQLDLFASHAHFVALAHKRCMEVAGRHGGR